MNKETLLQDMIEWFGDHKQANNDFMEHYGYCLNENDEYIKDELKILSVEEVIN